MTYNELNDITYAMAAAEYACLLGSLADGWREEEVLDDMKACIERGGDGFIETLSDEQLDAFAHDVWRRIV